MKPHAKPARRRADIAPADLADLNAGRRASANMVEGLAVDHAALLHNLVPEIPPHLLTPIQPTLGITKRMILAAQLTLDALGPAALPRLLTQPSDTARGWAAYVIALTPDLDLPTRLGHITPLADDPHFGVREWAWIALRPRLAADITASIALLAPWTASPSPNLRRFAVESTRPRGVWAAHIPTLKSTPDLGLPLLTPLAADPATYVQDSVANWLNDAAKDNPDWTRNLCASWLHDSASPATARICKRALRSL